MNASRQVVALLLRLLLLLPTMTMTMLTHRALALNLLLLLRRRRSNSTAPLQLWRPNRALVLAVAPNAGSVALSGPHRRHQSQPQAVQDLYRT